MNLNGKNVLVYGTGLSGIAASRLLLKVGANVILYDECNNNSIDNLIEGVWTNNGTPLLESKRRGDLEVITGKLTEDIIGKIDLVVMSPGVPLDIPLVKAFKSSNIPIWGEVELAYETGKGSILAITGTNGKTTTTAMLGEIMKSYHTETYVVGNIGIPYTGVALETTKESIIVAETSSFQLETIHNFKPKISSILNITEDHLDRHHTMEAYIEAKEQIAKNQDDNDICVLNFDNDITRDFANRAKPQVIFFSKEEKLDKGVYLSEGNIYVALHEREILCHVDELSILGEHNHENVMAAAAMAIAFGVPIDVVRKAVIAFKGVAHRLEFVIEKNNVVYYNDSKATNPDSAIKGIQAMNRPTVLIGGGYDKNSDYHKWIESFDNKVKTLVVVGATKKEIAKTARAMGFNQVIMANSFDEAVITSMEIAKPGDAVLLSPACASWGMFENYEKRGDRFKSLVLGED